MSAAQELYAILTTPPPPSPGQASSSSSNSEATKHQALQTLRDSGDKTFLFLRTIVELTSTSSSSNSSSNTTQQQQQQQEELLFHCVLGLRHVILFRWSHFSIAFTNGVRDFLWALGVNVTHAAKSTTTTTTTTTTAAAGVVEEEVVVVSKPVANACLSASASFWKRSWRFDPTTRTINSPTPTTKEELHLLQSMSATHHPTIAMHPFQSARELIHCIDTILTTSSHAMASSSGEGNTIPSSSATNLQYRMATSSCNFLSILVGEFSGSVGAARYNCPLEFHRLSHLVFESGIDPGAGAGVGVGGGVGLVDVLKIGMTGLGGIVDSFTDTRATATTTNDVIKLELGGAIVSLTNDVLSWEFGSSGGRWGSSSSDTGTTTSGTGGGSVLVRPPESWRSYLIQPTFLGAVFRMYHSIRSSSNNSSNSNVMEVMGQFKHLQRQLFLLLSSITGPVFESREERIAYSGFLVDGCLTVLSQVTSDLTTTTSSTAGGTNGFVPANMVFKRQQQVESETVDMCCTITRLVTNFQLEGLAKTTQPQPPQQPQLPNLLTAIATVGDILLRQNMEELRSVGGDVEMVEGYDWRQEAIGYLLESVVLMSDDRWLNNTATSNKAGALDDTERKAQIQSLLATTLSLPLYRSYVTNRIAMAKMEEHYITANEADLEEVREEIEGANLEDEMTAAGFLGRLNLGESVGCLYGMMMGGCWNDLQRVFEGSSSGGGGDVVTPEAAATLEETRILVVCVCHLLTDDNSGETPVIPERILQSCIPSTANTNGAETTTRITQLVQSLMSIAEFQASKISSNSNNPNLSPLLAKTFLWFLTRWAPAYIRPQPFDYDTGGRMDGILGVWNDPTMAQQAVGFCVTLCLHYHCYWSQEGSVQVGATDLLSSLARRGGAEVGGDVRGLLMGVPAMERLATLHVITAGMTHISTAGETTADQVATASNAGLTPEMIDGYRRIPYVHRAKILTTLLVASSSSNGGGNEPSTNDKSQQIFNSCLTVVQSSLSYIIQALQSKTVKPHELHTQEQVCLCITLYKGIALSSDMSSASSTNNNINNHTNHFNQIPIFLTPSLPHLSALMTYYAKDLAICEVLLGFFRDYTEQFIAILDRENCLAVFRASADLLTHYSKHHCASSRAVAMGGGGTNGGVLDRERRLEEEQRYSDILCAIDLLGNLGSKDFIDIACSTTPSNAPNTPATSVGLTTDEVTNVIFYGLQQILALMTSGLLKYPTLARRYFALVGFMMDTYPEKTGPGSIPTALFLSLVETLLGGMSHTSVDIARNSLKGLAALARVHLEDSRLLAGHLMVGVVDGSGGGGGNPNLFGDALRRLLTEVVFSHDNIIWDRLEVTALALLPLAAVTIDQGVFGGIVEGIAMQVEEGVKREGLKMAFGRLMQADVVGKVKNGGCGGRMNRVRFRKDFEVFVKDIHSTVLVF